MASEYKGYGISLPIARIIAFHKNNRLATSSHEVFRLKYINILFLGVCMEVYQLDVLMEETRQLASKYRDATGQPLPVSHDLACYDAIRYLNLETPEKPEASVDAISTCDIADVILKDQKIQIKGRVQFASTKGKQQRIGQLNLDGNWDCCLLVLLNEDYDSDEIFAASKANILEAIGDKKINKRGAIELLLTLSG